MKVTVIPIIIGVLRNNPKLLNRQEDLEIKGQGGDVPVNGIIKTCQTTEESWCH